MGGNIPPTFNSTNLVSLDLGENKLSGTIPSFGVKTHPYLQIIRLRGIHLEGVIPQQLCSLSQLRILDIAQNNLTGKIPHCFGHLTAMTYIYPFMYPPYSQYTIPSFPPQPAYFPDYIMAVLKGEELQYSACKEYVVVLDLSCNGLVGSIPEELTNLSRLVVLNLFYNHLTGRIPEKISELRYLESLDLSNNNISGTIPASLSALTFLSYLNLSNNKLHGEIPTGRQLQTLNDPSIYAGNDGLYARPLPNKCNRGQCQQQPQGGGGKPEKEEKVENNNWENVLFYIVIMLGCWTGFSEVLVILLLHKEWRFALFHCVEAVMEYINPSKFKRS